MNKKHSQHLVVNVDGNDFISQLIQWSDGNPDQLMQVGMDLRETLMKTMVSAGRHTIEVRIVNVAEPSQGIFFKVGNMELAVPCSLGDLAIEPFVKNAEKLKEGLDLLSTLGKMS